MHIQRTKTSDKAFGFSPKQQQVIIIILTWAGRQPNSKPPVKKRNNQSQTVSLPSQVFIRLNNSEVFLV